MHQTPFCGGWNYFWSVSAVWKSCLQGGHSLWRSNCWVISVWKKGNKQRTFTVIAARVVCLISPPKYLHGVSYSHLAERKINSVYWTELQFTANRRSDRFFKNIFTTFLQQTLFIRAGSNNTLPPPPHRHTHLILSPWSASLSSCWATQIPCESLTLICCHSFIFPSLLKMWVF